MKNHYYYEKYEFKDFLYLFSCRTIIIVKNLINKKSNWPTVLKVASILKISLHYIIVNVWEGIASLNKGQCLGSEISVRLHTFKYKRNMISLSQICRSFKD